MATWDDVRRLALALPETSERVSRDLRQWVVRKKLFVWERPLRRADLQALGDAAPEGPILGARVEHVGAKEALIADDPGVFFTTPHFDGYAAILIRLDRIGVEDLEEAIVEAWLASAPKRLAQAYAESPASLGVAFARALAAKDFARIKELVHPDVDFRGMTPNRTWEARDPDGLVADILTEWFAETDEVETVDRIATDAVGDRTGLSYRFSGRNDGGPFVVEQQAYLTARDGRIDWMRVLCSGFRSV